ncbi:MAG: hypothetical protein FWC66_05640 [Oscillospiraceae bacterium]|nr:hypothetical protein [Oscillospiraceae bacterium]
MSGTQHSLETFMQMGLDAIEKISNAHSTPRKPQHGSQAEIKAQQEIIDLKNRVRLLSEEVINLRASNASLAAIVRTVEEKSSAVNKVATGVEYRANINAKTARNAIIMAEIIGPPVAKKNNRKWQ